MTGKTFKSFNETASQNVKEMDWFRFMFDGVTLGTICTIGIIGNILAMIVLSRPQMKSSINYILISKYVIK